MSHKSDNPLYFFFFNSAGLIKNYQSLISSHLWSISPAFFTYLPWVSLCCGSQPWPASCWIKLQPRQNQRAHLSQVHSEGRPWWDGHCRCAGRIRGCFDKTRVCSLLWVLRVEDRLDCHCLALFKSFDEQLPSKFLTDSGPCVCMYVCVCVCVCVKHHFRMIEMFKRTLPCELLAGLTFH